MTHLDDAALDELARLAGEATPGPWEECGHARGGCCCGNVWSLPLDFPVANTNTDPKQEYWSIPKSTVPNNAAFIAAANPATVAALVAEVRQLRQCLAGVRHSVQMSLAGLQDEPAFDVPLVVRGLGQTIDAIDAALDGGQ